MIGAMGVWRVIQRLGQAAANHSEALSHCDADSRSVGARVENAPPAVVLGVDGCALGMQVRTHRLRLIAGQPSTELPPIEEGQCHAKAGRREDGRDGPLGLESAARMKERCDSAVVHGLRGQPRNRRIEEEIREKALGILQHPDWHDFGPTFASQQLLKDMRWK